MSTHKHLDKICCAAVALALALTLVLMNASGLGIQAASRTLGYESRLFDDSIVHTIDIVMDDWEGFLAQCTDEEYVLCSVVIDGENCSNVAIRAKGNTSLSQVASYGNDRYSFKIEFDHYDSGKTYHGLDKLCLNNIIQDNTYMKDYLTYQMMAAFGVNAPLCSFAYLTVNGEDWGLYLAVEGVEDAFLQRNYDSGSGELYKPDTMDMGGGRGNGGAFDMEDWMAGRDDQTGNLPTAPFSDDQTESSQEQTMVPPDAVEGTFDPGSLPDSGTFDPESLGDGSFTPEDLPNSGTFDPGKLGGGMGGMMGSDDVSLIYTDDDYDSYSNIFDNAKTDLTDADRDRLIDALEQLNAGENIQDVVDVDEVIRYFVVHNLLPLRGGRTAVHDPLGLQSGLRRLPECVGRHRPGQLSH